MIQTPSAKRIAMTAAGGLILCSLGATVGAAAEIRVLSSVALTSALNQIAPSFEQTTGNKLNIGYSLIADIRKRILDGETADVIILSRPVMDELDKQVKFTSSSITNIAGTPIALAIRAGASKPDISTVDALKSTLLAAKSIAYADPAKGGAAGVYFARVVDRLNRELHFSSEQRAQVQQIVDRHRVRIDALMSGVRPQIRQEFDATNAEIDKVLTPDQRAAFAKMRMRMQGRRGMAPQPPPK